jgi:voltage-gated potassium channel
MELRDRIRSAILSVICVLIVGTLGYHLIERWDLMDSLYMTVITLTTVGYGEVHPIARTETRVFTMVLILGGMGVIFYALGTLAQGLVEGQIRDILGRRKVEKVLRSLSGHCIICGFGRIGRSIAAELALAKVPFVVVERDSEGLHELEEQGYLGILGDATSEEILREAGVERAKALISVASTDADNLYITLTAKSLNPQIQVIARAAEAAAERKLAWAGADRVVSPYRMSGQRMANLLLRPTVVEFLESSLSDPSVELVMEEVHLPEEGEFVGQDILSSGLRRDHGLIVVAIKRKDGRLVVNPAAGETLQARDVLIALGKREEFARLSKKINKGERTQA